MIKKESFTIEWITELSNNHRRADEILIEKVIMALHLLENLSMQNLDYIFKGGTSLILLLDEPKRFSIDIDIIIPDKNIDLHNTFDRIIENSQFTRYVEDERKDVSAIDKAHYKFYYKPVTNAREKEEYILLDIVFEKYKYQKIIERPIKSEFLKNDENNTIVKLPEINCILGDKLTAFAPNTTGVRYGKKKEIEIIKQLFDIGVLFDNCDNIQLINETFREFAKQELIYRDIPDTTYIEVLNDIFETSYTLSLRGVVQLEDFQELKTGLKGIVNFIFSERYSIDKAITHASKAAYLASLLKNNSTQFERFSMDFKSLNENIIENPQYNKLNKLKKSNIEAFYYWYKAIEIEAKNF